MQATEKHSDRRCNQRRQDSRRSNPRRRNTRRSNARLNRSFEVSVLDHNGKTVNISASGVYFEVSTTDVEAFPLGTSVPLQINAVTNTSEGQETKLKLSGKGTTIRNCIIENPNHANRLGVALKFSKTLHAELDDD